MDLGALKGMMALAILLFGTACRMGPGARATERGGGSGPVT